MRQRFYMWIVKDIMPDEYKWPLEIYVEGLTEFKRVCGEQLSVAADIVLARLEECFNECYAD